MKRADGYLGRSVAVPSGRRQSTRPMNRNSAPAFMKSSIHAVTGSATTTVFPSPASRTAFRVQGVSDPTNGGLQYVRFPHGSLSPSNPAGLGYGQASKSQSNSYWSAAIRSGGARQYPTAYSS